MRVTRIKIDRWRHFRNIEITPPDSPVICLVGSNGTGKSNILELIAASAQAIGLADGMSSPRGNAFAEDGDFSISFHIAPGTCPPIDGNFYLPESLEKYRTAWDRTLSVTKDVQGRAALQAGDVSGEDGSQLAHAIVDSIRKSQDIHYLSLDADRSYPEMHIQPHEVGSLFERDWEATKKGSAYQVTRNLYEEWFRFLIATENQHNNAFANSVRLARASDDPDPVYVDSLASYKDSLKAVLPHLTFLGVDSQRRTVRFDSTGVPLSFAQLSGGEREIAFLVGQIERFGLRKGLLLVDEPELHLNFDLLRTWIGFLKGSVTAGQIWLATHSLETVEVAGPNSTFLLERDPNTRTVGSAMSLASLPVISVLSRAIGSPAFSIESLVFIYVEGTEAIGERERYRRLCASSGHIRFIEGGNCRDVVRKKATLEMLAKESAQTLHVGAITDRDFRAHSEISALQFDGAHVLEVFEVENFFLHPPTLEALSAKLGRQPGKIKSLIQQAADQRAGGWAFEATRTDKAFADFPAPASVTRALVHGISWTDIAADKDAVSDKIAKSDPQLTSEQIAKFKPLLRARLAIYERLRSTDELWKRCEGKEVVASLVQALGFATQADAEQAIYKCWDDNSSLVPTELESLRAYVRGL